LIQELPRIAGGCPVLYPLEISVKAMADARSRLMQGDSEPCFRKIDGSNEPRRARANDVALRPAPLPFRSASAGLAALGALLLAII